MSVTRMTSSEAVRAVIGSDLESGTEMVDLVETELSSWESEVGGLVTERLRCGSVTDDADDTWVERRLDNYYTVSGEFRNIFTKIFQMITGESMTMTNDEKDDFGTSGEHMKEYISKSLKGKSKFKVKL